MASVVAKYEKTNIVRQKQQLLYTVSTQSWLQPMCSLKSRLITVLANIIYCIRYTLLCHGQRFKSIYLSG